VVNRTGIEIGNIEMEIGGVKKKRRAGGGGREKARIISG
jgi:hypothetical protein